MAGGAPQGNQNAKSGTIWKDAIRKAVMQKNGNTLRKLADKLIEEAEKGNIVALKELGDRLDGRAAQSLQISGDPDKPLITRVEQVIVDPANSGTT